MNALVRTLVEIVGTKSRVGLSRFSPNSSLVWIGGVLLVLSSGCATILGIEEASCDPKLDESCLSAGERLIGDFGRADAGFDAGADASIVEGDGALGPDLSGSTDTDSADTDDADTDEGMEGADGAAPDSSSADVDAGGVTETDSDDTEGTEEDATDTEGVEPEATGNELVTPEGDPGGVPLSTDAGTDASVDETLGQDAGPDAAAIERQLCATYCEELGAACDAVAPQYRTREACEAVCIEGLDVGEPGDVGVDTIHCRLNALRSGLAFGETEAVCESAGMAGIGECSPLCEVYCTLVQYKCPAQFADPVFFNDNYDTCLGACSAVPRPSDVLFGSDAPSADTLQCRMFHIQNAFGNALTHCPHTVGDGVCRSGLSLKNRTVAQWEELQASSKRDALT